MTKAYMIIDLQFGSTGKGLLAGYLAKQRQPDTLVTAWGPNAGHTYIDSDGREFIHRMLANGIVSPRLENILIGPGTVLDVETLIKEIAQAHDLIQGKRLVIHPNAAVVTEAHQREEARNVTIGSTMKGTGAAVIQRIIRDPGNKNTAGSMITDRQINRIIELGMDFSLSEIDYERAIKESEVMQIEGAQGYSLSIYHGFYPYTTSQDVTPSQVMADCAIPFHIKPEVYGTLRTFPIRVADRFDKDGNKIGTSGPGYKDQVELDWSEVGVPPELTTVTQLPRRIFSFSDMQLQAALWQCAPNKLFLNFCNYMDREGLEGLIHRIENSLDQYNKEGGFCCLEWLGTGPNHDDVIDMGIK